MVISLCAISNPIHRSAKFQSSWYPPIKPKAVPERCLRSARRATSLSHSFPKLFARKSKRSWRTHMRASEMDEALIDSTSEVLETMYFTEVTGRSGSTDVSGECFTARIDYSGHAAGAFGICIPLGTARDLAANFLGADESTVSIEQAREVTGE